jgi:hypothetical protein
MISPEEPPTFGSLSIPTLGDEEKVKAENDAN